VLLSDNDIRRGLLRGEIEITPWSPDLLQPASLDVRLGPIFLVYSPHLTSVDMLNPPPDSMTEIVIFPGSRFSLAPGMFALGSTIEHVSLPGTVAARLEGKSTLGRMGLLTHATAGFIDPGFNGQITLELTNLGPAALELTPGMRIGQLSFMRMSSPVDMPYGSTGLGSHYQGQRGPTPASAYAP
jgi:dCTP deaminase